MGTLRFLVAFQCVAFAMCIFFAYRIFTMPNAKTVDAEELRQRLVIVRTPDEWKKVGNLMVDAIAARGAAYDSLRIKSTEFFVGFAISMLCNAGLSVYLLRYFKSMANEVPEATLQAF